MTTIAPRLVDLIEPLRSAGIEVGVARTTRPAETLHIRRDGNCGYVCLERDYSLSGLIVAFQLSPTPEHGSVVLVTTDAGEDPDTAEEVVAAALAATGASIEADGTVLPNVGALAFWDGPRFVRL